jgi:uncharacterized protein with ParB-like and HNH nuclease domain
MSFQTPITIASIIEDIENNRYLLPAIQREFVWNHSKIEWLFDSLMRNYPVSSFLFWNVQSDIRTKFKFYSFLREYREKYKIHNQVFDTAGIPDFTAVLDGQQRLTAIYIGLKGTYGYKLPRVWWENSEKAIPTRKLYLNISGPLSDEEDGRIYNFKFLTDNEYREDSAAWFKVGKILDLRNNFEFNKFLDANDYKSNMFAYEALSKLQEAIHTQRTINFFLEKEQNIDKALNIFIRINSGGEPLDFSDLLMSIAVANWQVKDAREEIFKLVDEVRDKGFFISKDLILKTFLVLYSNDVKFKVTNFSADNAKDFEVKWDSIKLAILETFELVKSFGYVESTLTSKNALIPIIYYLYHRNIYPDFHTKIEFSADRKIIAKWLHIVLLKRLFGGQADSILTAIRSVLTDDISKKYIKDDIVSFPYDKISSKLTGTNKNMGFDKEFIDKLLLTQKDDNYAFSILALLYDNLDYTNATFHKDHIHPGSYFKKSKLKEMGIPEPKYDFYLNTENYNSILNLQMLDANENKSKQDKDLQHWVSAEIECRKLKVEEFCHKQQLPIELSFQEFPKFIENRRSILSTKLSQLL